MIRRLLGPLVVGVLLTTVPIMVWVERRGSALIQDRLGPNRVGPFGLLQPVVDAVKLMTKENLIPSGVNLFLYVLAPIVSLQAYYTLAGRDLERTRGERRRDRGKPGADEENRHHAFPAPAVRQPAGEGERRGHLVPIEENEQLPQEQYLGNGRREARAAVAQPTGTGCRGRR